MARSDNVYQVPDDLPVPEDDGACDGLVGRAVRSIPLAATSGGRVDLAMIEGRPVASACPGTGGPDRGVPAGWNAMPGARGCTPQSCAFRDRHAEVRALGARVFGLSTQDTDYQREAAERLRLPFDLLSDAERAL